MYIIINNRQFNYNCILQLNYINIFEILKKMKKTMQCFSLK